MGVFMTGKQQSKNKCKYADNKHHWGVNKSFLTSWWFATLSYKCRGKTKLTGYIHILKSGKNKLTGYKSVGKKNLTGYTYPQSKECYKRRKSTLTA